MVVDPVVPVLNKPNRKRKSQSKSLNNERRAVECTRARTRGTGLECVCVCVCISFYFVSFYGQTHLNRFLFLLLYGCEVVLDDARPVLLYCFQM